VPDLPHGARSLRVVLPAQVEAGPRLRSPLRSVPRKTMKHPHLPPSRPRIRYISPRFQGPAVLAFAAIISIGGAIFWKLVDGEFRRVFLRAAIRGHYTFDSAYDIVRDLLASHLAGLFVGVFLAGSAQSPKDIPDTVAHASAAGSKALELFSKPVLHRDPIIARVSEGACNGCFDCERVCPYRAMERKEIRDRQGNLIRLVARVNEAMCEGCGLCTAACRSRSIDLFGFSEEQIFAQLAAVAPAPIEAQACLA